MKKIVLIIILILGFTWTSTAQSNQSKQIEVVGKAIIKLTPEDMIVSMPIDIKDSTYLKCHSTLVSKLNQIKQALKQNGIKPEQIETQNFSVQENYSYSNGTNKKVGYRGFVEVKVKKTYTPKALDKLIKTAVNQQLNYRVYFNISDKQQLELTKRALKIAVADAKEKAQILANAAEVELGDIKKINYENINSRPEMFARTELADAPFTSKSASVALNPKEMQITKEVLIIWQIN